MLIIGFWLSAECFAALGKSGLEQLGWQLAMGDSSRYVQLTEKCGCVCEIRNLSAAYGQSSKVERGKL